MNAAFELTGVSKSFGAVHALEDFSLSVPSGSVVGLIGRNGCGKTTLLKHVVGLYLPSTGTMTTLGCETSKLGADELSQIGIVHQESRFLVWMKVAQHLRYVASFHREWDTDREQRLLRELELDPGARVATLSPGNRQKLALILAVCHHPRLLILDEPMASMDPIAREQLFEFLLDLLQEDGNTTVISSHALRDVERIVDRVVCMESGELVVDSSLDSLYEGFAEWIVTSQEGSLPARFAEGFVLEQHGDTFQQRVLVRDAGQHQVSFAELHRVEVETQPMNLERIFPLLIRKSV